MKNFCGECSVCCTALRISKNEIFWKTEDKLEGKTCEKLCEGQCSVYEKRPEACSKFKCLWLQLLNTKEELSDAFRPDNLNILVEFYNYKESNEFIFSVKELMKGILNFNDLSPKIDELLKALFILAKRQNYPTSVVIFPFGLDKGHKLVLDD